jgi:cation transport ATPase
MPVTEGPAAYRPDPIVPIPTPPSGSDDRRVSAVPDAQSSQAHDDPGRRESNAERDDRNLMELLQELRVAGLGVQVLFGFLLSLPFTTQFVKLHHAQRLIYQAALLLAALAIVLLTGPVAYHRLVFRQHRKGSLVRAANVMAIAGLAAVGLATSSAIWLVVSFVDRGAPVVVIPILAVSTFAGLWFVLPLASSRRDGGRAHD